MISKAGLMSNALSTTATDGLVRRTPFYFDSEGDSLFAWLHRDSSATPCQGGVIICHPWGYEQIHSHRSLRHLADALAGAGYAVMRFDLHGTGDSPGSDEDADRHRTWLANLRSAVHWMQNELDGGEISLVGVRLGAALAAQVAVQQRVANFVLWAPVVKGRAYVRELRALGLTAGGPPNEGKDIEAAGFVMTEQTAQDLGGIDLLQTRPQCRRVLIVGRDDLPSDNKLLDYLRSLGIEADQTVQPGYAGMMAEPHFTTVPRRAIDEIVTWMRVSQNVGMPPTPDPPPRKQGEGGLARSISMGPWCERAVQICEQPELFGILSEAAASPVSANENPAIVLVNAGSAYRVGPNRLHVLLARRLAASGFRCLRMDLAGLGDSVTPDSALENDPYPATAFRDIDLAMKYLQREVGVRRIVLMGLCSGAYAAFQSAVQFECPVLVASFIVNPLTFHWQRGMTVESPESLKFKVYNDTLASARQPGKWLKLLTGRSKLGIRGAVRILVNRWQLRRQAQQLARQSTTNHVPAALPSHPGSNDLPGDLARAVKAGRPLTFFFARSDPGYDILTFYAKRQVEEMSHAGQMRIVFLEYADHTFSRRAARDAMFEAVVTALDF